MVNLPPNGPNVLVEPVGLPPPDHAAEQPGISFNERIQVFVDGIKSSFRKINASIFRQLDAQLIKIRNAYLRLVYCPNFNSFEFKESVQQTFREKNKIEQRLALLNEIDYNYFTIRQILKDLDYLYTNINKNLFFLENAHFEMQAWGEQNNFFNEIETLKIDYARFLGQFDFLFTQKGTVLHSIFKDYSTRLIQASRAMPESIRKDLLVDWNYFKNAVLPNLPIGITSQELRNTMTNFENDCIQQGFVANDAMRPLALPNFENSCYLDSAFQLLFCTEEARSIVNSNQMDVTVQSLEGALEAQNVNEEDARNIRHTLIDKRTTLNERKKIRGEINSLLRLRLSPSVAEPSPLDYFLSVLHGPSLRRLRDFIFQSRLHCELAVTQQEPIYAQRDAAAVVEFGMENILEMPFSTQRLFESTDHPNLRFKSPLQNSCTLACQIAGETTLQEVINSYFDREFHVNDQANAVFLNPEEASLIDPAIETLRGAAGRTSNYQTWFELKSMPKLMAVHVKRFNNHRIKNDSVVHLTEEIDLTPYFGGTVPEGSMKTKVVGYVVHSGTYYVGHYVAYVMTKENGIEKYWFVDDLGPVVREITKEDFFSNKKAYIILLAQVPPEDQVET